MSIVSLDLAGYRSYSSKKKIAFSPETTLIVGRNTAGKTNLLEALYVSQYGVSFRSSQFSELFNLWLDSFSLQLIDSENTELKIHAIKKPSLSKSFFVNGTKKTLSIYITRTSGAVVFEPADVLLASGVPEIRRRYLDTLLSVHDREYAFAKTQYERGLYKRNKLIAETKIVSNTFFRLLEQYDQFLIPYAGKVTSKRQAFLEYCNANPDFAGSTFSVIYEKNPFTLEIAEFNRQRDLAVRRTTFGPQRDDFILCTTMRDNSSISVASFGSRSQQRMAVLWLKRNELQYIETVYKKNPLCLLDDVFSEFDHEHSKRIMQITSGRQTVITTADKDVVPVIQSKEAFTVNL